MAILSAYWRTAPVKSKQYWWFIGILENVFGQKQIILVTLSTYSDKSKLYWWFYRHTGKQPQSGANYSGDIIDILENILSQEQTILVILSAYWRTSSDKSKLYWWFYRHTGEQPKTGANYTGDFIDILENSLSQGQTILLIISTHWRTASVRSKLYLWFYRHTGEQPLTEANYTGDFIGMLENSLRQEQTKLILSAYWRTASVRGKLYWWFYRHTGEQPPTEANYTCDFIDILENILSQEQPILVLLSAAYLRIASDMVKLYLRFYWHTGEQPQSGTNYTGDFIGMLENSLRQEQTKLILSVYWRTASVRNNLYCYFIGILENIFRQEQTILVILSTYWRTSSGRSKLYRWFYRHIVEQPRPGANYPRSSQ